MDEINIKDFFSYLKRYILAFIILTVLVVGGVFVYDSMIKQPIYQAQTTVVIAKSDMTDGTAASLNDINASQKLATTYSEIAKSELVLKKVIESLGLHVGVKELSKSLTIKPVNDTSILSITVKDPNAKLAATIANEIAKVFSAEVIDIYKIENVTQLSVAVAPENPANNTLTRDMVLAVAIAVLAVTGFAFLRFYLDDTVKHNDDVEKIIGLPVTGQILKGDVKSRKASGELIAEKMPKAIVSENIKSLRTNLQFTAVDKDLRTILVTSTNASEGKSFVSANLAISFAQADKKVLLIDCDLRRGRLHKLFDIANTGGLSNLLTSDLRSLGKYIRSTKIKNLDIITCGTYPPNPSELLASKKNKRLIKALCGYYDLIIFDGAPVGGLADSVILSSLMDETLIVVKDGNTTKADLITAKDSLEKVGAKVAGVVFNMVNRKASKYYNNYYYGSSK
ncbi:polysaccharide biosynthesis tyrosine autokinase [Candidatus Saccharibacteria bacterium]|nr:polysaccharide biosynthesis tyrosine autokinase [Candidatus Saccharibacteria bacterium]